MVLSQLSESRNISIDFVFWRFYRDFFCRQESELGGLDKSIQLLSTGYLRVVLLRRRFIKGPFECFRWFFCKVVHEWVRVLDRSSNNFWLIEYWRTRNSEGFLRRMIYMNFLL